MVREMRKLRRLLKKNHFIFREENTNYNNNIIYWDQFYIHIFNNENDKIKNIIVTNGFGSEGGYDIVNHHNKGLLEIFIKDKDKNYGNLKAREVIKILKEERGF